jgi:phage terminase small subunit
MTTEFNESQQTEQKTALTARQRKIIPLLVTCATFTETCEKAKLNRTTLYKWLKDPAFRAEVERQRVEVTQEAFGMLSQNLTKAIETLAGLLDDSDKRLKRFAANDIIGHFLRYKELDELTRRIEAIEKALQERHG